MTDDEKITTIRNVLSDLQAILQDYEQEYQPVSDAFEDAKMACEYITNEVPHL